MPPAGRGLPAIVPFRPAFDCLWCGTRHSTRASTDLEGWAQLCPACVGRAGDNEFLRFRLRRALESRASATPDAAGADGAGAPGNAGAGEDRLTDR